MELAFRPDFISHSKEMSHEYCATVVRIGEVKPVENSDYLGVVDVEGRDIVVRRDRVREGDIMIYVSNECQLDQDFLHLNNEFQDEELNANYKEVREQVEKYRSQGINEDEIKAYIQAHRGYFDKKCRVRMKKLRGVMSMGYLITPEQMSVYKEELKGFNWEERLGEDFDCAYGALFVKAYVPEIKEPRVPGKGRAEKAIKRFNRMIPGQFAFHYDTQQLQRNMDRLRPNSSVSITTKLHGTSAIYGDVKVKQPRWSGLYTRLFNYLPNWLRFTKEGYDLVYSSRSVIKNATLNPSVTGGFYDTDVWAEYQKILKDLIPQGMTIYGEIVGYITKSTKGIQSLGGKVYDYGCKPGENKLMIYRIKTTEDDGSIKEWDVEDVYEATEELIETLQTIDDKNGTHYADRIIPINILFNGKLKDLYPDLTQPKNFKQYLKARKPVEGEDKFTRDARIKHNKILKKEVDYMNNWMSVNGKTIDDFLSEVVSHDSLIYKIWQEQMLSRLKNDQYMDMEMDEPLCINKLPREGIVLRINDDPLTEAFKLKCLKFLNKEAEDVDKGKADSEMTERY